MIVYFEPNRSVYIFWSKSVGQKTICSSDLSSCWITDTGKQVIWKSETKLEPNVRGYHSHFTSNYRPSTQYECSVSVQWQSTFSRRSEKSMHAVLTLTCTLILDNQDQQVTHVGRKEVQKACISWDRLTALFTVNRHYTQWAVSPLRWGLVVLLGRYQDHVNINRHGFLSRLHLEQVNNQVISPRATESGHASLRTRQRYYDAGFPRSDGRLVVWACSAAARSRLALKRSSLSFEHSLDTLTAARLRWSARRSSLCSLSSLDRLTKFPATFARRWHTNAPKPSHPRWRQFP